MKRSWNLILLVGFLLTLAAFFSYFFVFAYFPVTRDFPWVNLLLFATGLALLAIGLRRAFRERARYRGRISGSILSALSVAVLGLFLFYNFSFSRQLPSSERAPQVGEKAPDFTLPDAEGQETSLATLVGQLAAEKQADGKERWLLLVFYRGYW